MPVKKKTKAKKAATSKYFATYDQNDMIVWGIGLTPEESIRDAVAYFYGAAPKFNTLPCSKQTYKTVEAFGCYSTNDVCIVKNDRITVKHS